MLMGLLFDVAGRALNHTFKTIFSCCIEERCLQGVVLISSLCLCAYFALKKEMLMNGDYLHPAFLQCQTFPLVSFRTSR